MCVLRMKVVFPTRDFATDMGNFESDDKSLLWDNEDSRFTLICTEAGVGHI